MEREPRRRDPGVLGAEGEAARAPTCALDLSAGDGRVEARRGARAQ